MSGSLTVTVRWRDGAWRTQRVRGMSGMNTNASVDAVRALAGALYPAGCECYLKRAGSDNGAEVWRIYRIMLHAGATSMNALTGQELFERLREIPR